MKSLTGRIDEFLHDVCAGKINETPAAYRSKLRRLDQWMQLQQIALADLTAEDVRLFCRDMLRQSSKRTGAPIILAKARIRNDSNKSSSVVIKSGGGKDGNND